MIPAARAPRSEFQRERLLIIDPGRELLLDSHIEALPSLLRPPDLVVVNESGTLPASLKVSETLELRLAGRMPDGTWQAVVFGQGDHRLPTELRGPPPCLQIGQTLELGPDLHARVLAVAKDVPRLIRLEFTERGASFWQALYRSGRPIQYSYMEPELQLWDVQTRFAAAPWSVEMPSATRPLSFGILTQLRRRGVRVASVCHAAGLSSTGDTNLDGRLPLPERYQLSATTVRELERTRLAGGRVLAVGTSVVRALESNVERFGKLQPTVGLAELVLSNATPARVVDGVLSGLHEPGTSHFSLLEAFASSALLERSARHAEQAGYVQHEFGDSCIVWRVAA